MLLEFFVFLCLYIGFFYSIYKFFYLFIGRIENGYFIVFAFRFFLFKILEFVSWLYIIFVWVSQD